MECNVIWNIISWRCHFYHGKPEAEELEQGGKISVQQRQNQTSLWAVVLWERQSQNHGQCFHSTLNPHIYSHS